MFGDRLCPHSKLAIEKDHTYLEHLVETHQELQLGSVDEITNIIVSASPAIIQTGAWRSSRGAGQRSFLLGLCPKVKNEWNKWKNHFHEMKGHVGM